MKRDELHSLGVDLASGELVTQFHQALLTKRLTPRFPINSSLPRQILSVTKARAMMELFVEKQLKQVDHSWAASARERMEDELSRVDTYYSELHDNSDPEEKPTIASQWESRKQEMEWQYSPRIRVSVINCGMFHLRSPMTS